MIRAYVEPSGEAPELAREEIRCAAVALGGKPAASSPFPALHAVELPDAASTVRLADRLALARRCLLPIEPPTSLAGTIAAEGRKGRSAAFRRIGGSAGGTDDGVRAAGREYRDSGGTIDLDHPQRRYWIASDEEGREVLFLEVARVDRTQSASRRMPLLPFQRPVALAPRLARAAANLAQIRSGDRVLDPFLGTGALLAEAAFLGARVYGIDRDPAMIVGALRNLAHLGLQPAEVVEADAGQSEFRDPDQRFDALLTDPPYGRSSGTGGEEVASVLGRVLPRWAARVVPGGRVVVVAPTGSDALGEPWIERTAIPVRVHRSLTREFRVYERPG